MPTDDPGSNRSMLRRYMGLAMQWLAMILAAILLGRWLDDKMNNRFPALTFLLLLLTITGLLVQVVRDTMRTGKRTGRPANGQEKENSGKTYESQ